MPFIQLDENNRIIAWCTKGNFAQSIEVTEIPVGVRKGCQNYKYENNGFVYSPPENPIIIGGGTTVNWSSVTDKPFISLGSEFKSDSKGVLQLTNASSSGGNSGGNTGNSESVIENTDIDVNITLANNTFYKLGTPNSITINWDSDEVSSKITFTVENNDCTFTCNSSQPVLYNRNGKPLLSFTPSKNYVYEIDCAIIGDKKVVKIFEVPTAPFVTNWSLPAGVFALPTQTNTVEYSACIDWGDGTEPSFNYVGNPTHTYAVAGNYTISIYGKYNGILINGNTAYTTKLISIESFGNVGFTSLASAFKGCTSLLYVGQTSTIPLGSLDKVADASSCFYGCTALKRIPHNMFKDNKFLKTIDSMFYNCQSLELLEHFCVNSSALTVMSSCFYNCIALRKIYDSFINCTSLNNVATLFSNVSASVGVGINIDSSFNNCPSISDISTTFKQSRLIVSIDNSFNDCPKIITFASCFYVCAKLKSITNSFKFIELTNLSTVSMSLNSCFNTCESLVIAPIDIFNRCSLATDASSCFYGCISLTTLPDGIFDKCVALTNMNQCFYKCGALTTLPDGLFDKCVALTTATSCFMECKSIVTLPNGLFSKCDKLTTLSSCFYTCTSLTAVPINMLDNCVMLVDISSCFTACTSLTSIPSDLLIGCVALTTVASCFYGCTSITAIPDGLFDNCIALTNMSQCFYGCTSITAIPDGLFDNCIVLTNMTQCFMYCKNLALTATMFSVDWMKSVPKRSMGSCFAVSTKSNSHTGSVPDIWTYNTTGSSDTNCFLYCTALSNYADIPTNWR